MRGRGRPISHTRTGGSGVSRLTAEASMRYPRAAVARGRFGLVSRARGSRGLRFPGRVRARNHRFIFDRSRFGMMHRLGRSVYMRRRSGCSGRVVMHAGAMRGSRMIMPPMRRTDSGAMPGRVTRRTRHSVNVRRIMPMPAMPRRRSPGRHQASRCQRGKREHRCTSRRITIHRLSIIITEYRETICIITGIRPADRCVPARAAHIHRCSGIHGVRICSARTEQHRGRCH
jgi:hypothetical protein